MQNQVTQDGRNPGGQAGGRRGGSRSAGGGAGSLGPAQMRKLVPENVGNSRIYAASELLARGGQRSQQELQRFDIDTYLGQMGGLNSRNIRFAVRDGQISVPSGSGSVSVSASAYRRFAAQANRDLRRIYRSASEETKDAWALVVAGNHTGAKNRGVGAIARDLNRRYQRIQEREAAMRRRRSRRSLSDLDEGDLDDLFL